MKTYKTLPKFSRRASCVFDFGLFPVFLIGLLDACFMFSYMIRKNICLYMYFALKSYVMLILS